MKTEPAYLLALLLDRSSALRRIASGNTANPSAYATDTLGRGPSVESIDAQLGHESHPSRQQRGPIPAGWQNCPACHGTGWQQGLTFETHHPCGVCGGEGVTRTPALLTLQALRDANRLRQEEWCKGKNPDASFRAVELAGETGEACNVVKKLERERHGWAGSRDTAAHLAEELADVIIAADLLAERYGINLSDAVKAKFNATSEERKLTTKL